ncbi:MAG: 2-oxo acid dehydrogenase subunit E2, partial [Actinomycetota bacterium]|nr:2-oxo acid dehydrogenase subunit E2 [Actinomycetota bacterium]
TVTRSDVEAAARLAPPATSAPPAPPAPASPPVPARAPVPVAPAPHAGPARARSSPYARRLAAGAGVHVGALVGSGPGGAVVAEDVIAALASGGAAPQAPASPAGPAAPPAGPAAPVAPAAPSTESTSREDRAARLRRAIGNLMSRSKREIPHYYLATTVDLSSARTWLDEVNASRPVTDRLVMGTLLLAAAARAVAAVPEVNGSYQDGVFTPSPSVHLGVAISLRTGGVLAPAIHDADTKSVDELMAALSDLVKRARGGVLRGTELADATLTVTNLGDLGVDEVQGVIFPPQVALVGYGRVSERPMVAGGQVVARTAVTVTLAADHRVSDGHRGGRYLAEIDRLLQRPEDL